MTKQGMTLLEWAGFCDPVDPEFDDEFGLEDIQFEHDYRNWEKNRMYPVGYGKESAMRKMTQRHCSAISHAENFIFPAMKKNLTARSRKEMEVDLQCLSDIKQFLYQVAGQTGMLSFEEFQTTKVTDGHKDNPQSSG